MTGPKEARAPGDFTLRQQRRRTLSVVRWRLGLCAASLAVVAASCGGGSAPGPAAVERVSGGPTGTYIVPAGIHKIKHIIVIQQENRSFDSYFGTYPGADGIPMKNGVPTVCVNDPQTGQCVAPYLDHADVNGGGPHSAPNATADINGGKMDGFIAQAQSGRRGCLVPTDPACTNSADARRDGLPQRERHPQLLDVRQGLRPAGPHVRAERLLEPAVPPLPRLGVVGLLHAGRQPLELCQRAADQAGRATPAGARGLRRPGRTEERRQPAAPEQAHGGGPARSTPGRT